MATRGKPLSAATIQRIRRCCEAFRLSVRKTARECGVAPMTVQKYKK